MDEAFNDLPNRSVGEIAVQSGCMLTEYFNRPDATEAAIKTGWYLTGDYGYIAHGKNVYPQDLETLAGEVDGVHAGCTVAFGMYNEEEGTEEAIIIAEAETTVPSEMEAIADVIRKHVTKSSAIALRHVKIVDEKWIIKTSSGKTARSANKEKF